LEVEVAVVEGAALEDEGGPADLLQPVKQRRAKITTIVKVFITT
jgi:hypothetical protein